jgi:SWI/SNF related-matrix-associated actin-dependent regulator of chromatin subfamily C
MSPTREYLCGLCYAEGKYSAGQTASDFLKVDLAALDNSVRAPWREEDLAHLLTVVEEAVDAGAGNSIDWDAVALKVDRPKDQCIFQFLRLPSLLELPAPNQGAEMDATDRLAKHISANPGLLPFTSWENPVIATLVYLAAAVHPKVAAAAAHAAITAAGELKGRDNAMDMDMKEEHHQAESLDQIAATSVACAAAKAEQFAAEEQKKQSRLRENLLELQLQKLKVKMTMFEDLERGLEVDRKELEQQRLQLFFDRFNLKRQMLTMEQKIASSEQENNGEVKITSPSTAPDNRECVDEMTSESKRTKLTSL